MNVLLLTLLDFKSLEEHNIYSDLLREFARNGHSIYVVSPTERRNHEQSYSIKTKDATILKVKTGNITKCNIVEKGISTILIQEIFINGIKDYFSNTKFDLLLYSTPPVTFEKVIKFVKKRDHASTYLLLKDIFPQNAVDINLLSKKGIRGIAYRFFRKKEKELYQISDYIGCMSQANVDYILKHNPEISSNKVEVCPNSIEVNDKSLDKERGIRIRKKYGIPLNKVVFIYGGNLGKPQGIPFLIECLKSQEGNNNIFFLIVGNGTEYPKLKKYVEKFHPSYVKLMKGLSKEDYDNMVGACDVGMIFLDHRFTIPNFPSRILSYMHAKIPIIAVTDVNTDIGKIIVENRFGWWCESNNLRGFKRIIKNVISCDRKELGNCAFNYLQERYEVKKTYKIIVSHLLDVGEV